jgi:hypothetical protein
MPKPKTKLSIKLKSYLNEFPDILSINESNNQLFCKVCQKEIKKAFKKYSLKQHFGTQKHLSKLKLFNNKSIDFNNNSINNNNIESETNSQLISEKLKLKVLENIKQLVKQLINECNCHSINSNKIKEELNDLIIKYEKMIEKQNKSEENEEILENKEKSKNKSLKLKKEKSLLSCLWPGCDMSFDIQSKLNNHFRCHTGEKKYVCDWPQCQRKYNRLSVFRYHLELHKSGQHLKRFKCEWNGCQKMFALKYHMTRHLRVNHLKIEKFKCEWPQCGLGFPSKDRLDVHLGETHLKQNLYKCQWNGCEKRYKTKTHLQVIHNYYCI